MVRLIKGTGGLIAAVSAAILISAAVVIFSATLVGEHLIAMQTAKAAAPQPQPHVSGFTVNRERKSDALPKSAAAQTRSEIKTVEVIGVRDASIVYRDRDGNILFQTDPLANVTIVTKNIDLPEVTIRNTETTKVERVPVEGRVPVESKAPTARLPGCESAFARPSPESLTRKSSRCVTELPSPKVTNFAALR
jgi:hypothetical protein